MAHKARLQGSNAEISEGMDKVMAGPCAIESKEQLMADLKPYGELARSTFKAK